MRVFLISWFSILVFLIIILPKRQNNNINQTPKSVNFTFIKTEREQNLYPVPKFGFSPESSKKPLISSPLAIMVISARQNNKARQAIRETWAKNHSNVIFIVGREYCHLPEQLRKRPWECVSKVSENKLENNDKFRRHLKHYTETEVNRNKLLEKEERVILVDGFIDSYRNLSAKIYSGYDWISENFDMDVLKWVMKCDDDVYVRVDKMELYLELAQEKEIRNGYSWYGGFANYMKGRLFDYKRPTVIGQMNPSTMVKDINNVRLKNIKWKDVNFFEKRLQTRNGNKTHYPVYPDGGASYIFSRYIFDYIIKNIKKQRRQNRMKGLNLHKNTFTDNRGVFNWPVEDAGFGILLYRSPFRDQIGLFNRCNSSTWALPKSLNTYIHETHICKNDQELEKLGGILERKSGPCKGGFQGIVFSHNLSPELIRKCYKKITLNETSSKSSK